MSDNIEKHAAAPLYPPTSKHPHPEYKDKLRLKITRMSREMRELQQTFSQVAEMEGKHWLDYVKVRDLQCECPNKALYEKILDLNTPSKSEVMAYNSCKHTIFAAAKRQMKAAPTPDPKVADEFLAYAKAKINKEVGEQLKHFGYSYQQWYHHLERPKQIDMDRVAIYLKGDRTKLSPEEIKMIEAKNYEGICKVELQAVNGKPRMVCSIPKLTKYVMGPVCWKLEEIFSKHFKGYCGGKNLKQMSHSINELIDQGFTKVVEGDGSAFDNTQDITLKRVDHYIYESIEHAIHHCDKTLFHEITHQPYKTMDVNYIDAKSKKKKTLLTYSILGSVFSGDADTTLCNTTRMALYNRFVNDKAGLVYGRDYVCFSKGDDFTVLYKPYITNEMIHAIYYKYFLKASPSPDIADTRVYGLGQVLKMLDIGGPETIKFCSLRAWYIDDSHIILTRDPAKFYDLAKYSRKIKTLTPIKRAAYLRMLAIALRADYSKIHIFEAMASAYDYMAERIEKIHKIDTKSKAYKNKIRAAQQYFVKAERLTTSPHNENETPTYQLLYDVAYREENIKIIGGYWETMKKIERTAFYHLTTEQYILINQQIEAEFSTEELKSMMGLKH